MAPAAQMQLREALQSQVQAYMAAQSSVSIANQTLDAVSPPLQSGCRPSSDAVSSKGFQVSQAQKPSPQAHAHMAAQSMSIANKTLDAVSLPFHAMDFFPASEAGNSVVQVSPPQPPQSQVQACMGVQASVNIPNKTLDAVSPPKNYMAGNHSPQSGANQKLSLSPVIPSLPSAPKVSGGPPPRSSSHYGQKGNTPQSSYNPPIVQGCATPAGGIPEMSTRLARATELQQRLLQEQAGASAGSHQRNNHSSMADRHGGYESPAPPRLAPSMSFAEGSSQQPSSGRSRHNGEQTSSKSHTLKVLTKDGRWESLNFNRHDNLESLGSAFLNQHGLKAAFRYGLVEAMQKLAASGQKQSSVDIIDLL